MMHILTPPSFSLTSTTGELRGDDEGLIIPAMVTSPSKLLVSCPDSKTPKPLVHSQYGPFVLCLVLRHASAKRPACSDGHVRAAFRDAYGVCL